MGEHPVLKVLGALAAVATILTFVLQVDIIPGDDNGGDGNRTLACQDPALSLSQGSGPSGTEVTIRGTGYPSDEAVDVRFHTEALLPSRTGSDGAFEVKVVIPGTFDVFAPNQFEIHATTTPTVCSASAQFQLTR